MATAQPLDFAELMSKVAPLLCGTPNAKMSRGNKLRFGTHGSMEIDTSEGWFHDHETKAKGGLLALIQHKLDCDMAGALAWLEQQGLKERESRAAEVRQLGAHRTGPVFYDYRDESGEILSRVKRTPDKRFFQLGPNGTGGFHSVSGCMDGVRRVPYRLPELLAADPKRIVFVVEGEKDADRLATLGFVATCNAEGAGKFRPELVAHFAGRKVVVISDNDQPGRDHAADVVEKLTGTATAAAILELPGLPRKGDASDWLDAGGSVDDLKEMAKASLAASVNTDAGAAGDGSTTPAEIIRATPFVWKDPASIPLRPWVYGRWLLRNTITAVVAPGGVGKSSLMASTILSLTTGRSLLGKTVWDGPKRVWYWNLEDDGEELSRQIHAAARYHQVAASECEDRLFVDSGLDGARLCTAIENRDGMRIVQPVIEALTAELIIRKIDVLVVDPFVSSHAVSENDNGAMDAVAKEWARIAKAANCSIVLVHHTRKLGGMKVTAEMSRGAVAVIAAARSTLVLNRMDAEEAKRFAIEGDEERRRIFSVQDDKANRAPPEKADWHRIVSVDLGNDPDGQNGDNIGVVTGWTPPDLFEGVSSETLLSVQTAVAAGNYRADQQARDWVGYAVAKIANVDIVTHKKRVFQWIKTWVENDALTIEDGKDEGRKTVKFVRVGQWVHDGAPPVRVERNRVERSRTEACSTTPPYGVGGGAERSIVPDSEVEHRDEWNANAALGRNRDGAPLDLGRTRF